MRIRGSCRTDGVKDDLDAVLVLVVLPTVTSSSPLFWTHFVVDVILGYYQHNNLAPIRRLSCTWPPPAPPHRTHELSLMYHFVGSPQLLSTLHGSTTNHVKEKVHARGEVDHALLRLSPLVPVRLWLRIHLLDGMVHLCILDTVPSFRLMVPPASAHESLLS